MEGDPYCTHCGAHLHWSNDNSYNQKHEPNNLDDLLSSMYINPVQKAFLKAKLEKYLKIKINIHFRVNDKRRVYTLDLDRMELDGEYREYDL